MAIIKTYSELITLSTFEERFQYLKLPGSVGASTFGYDRWINQSLYTSGEWRRFRKDIILRDMGCDLAIPGFEVMAYGTIHHINPVTKEDIVNRNQVVFDPENVIFTSSDTHRAIHYGDENGPITKPVERSRNDTCPWRN